MEPVDRPVDGVDRSMELCRPAGLPVPSMPKTNAKWLQHHIYTSVKMNHEVLNLFLKDSPSDVTKFISNNSSTCRSMSFENLKQTMCAMLVCRITSKIKKMFAIIYILHKSLHKQTHKNVNVS